jgi:hypothetical protein
VQPKLAPSETSNAMTTDSTQPRSSPPMTEMTSKTAAKKYAVIGMSVKGGCSGLRRRECRAVTW